MIKLEYGEGVIYMCVCVCWVVRVKETERDKQLISGGKQRQADKQKKGK